MIIFPSKARRSNTRLKAHVPPHLIMTRQAPDLEDLGVGEETIQGSKCLCNGQGSVLKVLEKRMTENNPSASESPYPPKNHEEQFETPHLTITQMDSLKRSNVRWCLSIYILSRETQLYLSCRTMPLFCFFVAAANNRHLIMWIKGNIMRIRVMTLTLVVLDLG